MTIKKQSRKRTASLLKPLGIHPFPMNSHAKFLWQVFWLMLHSKKRPSRKKQWDKNVFSSAITAEGAAADFNRVPFYRKIAAIKIADIQFPKSIIDLILNKVNKNGGF